MERTQVARARIAELKARIADAGERKKYFEDYVNKLNKAYIRGEIKHGFYVETLYLHRNGRNILEWIEFYNGVIKDCEDLIKKQRLRVVKTVLPLVFFFLIISIFIVLPIFQLKFSSSLTGFAVQQPGKQSSPEISAEAGVNATVDTIQHEAILEQPVKWTKRISLDKPSDLLLNLPSEAKNIIINEANSSGANSQSSYSGQNPEEALQNQTSPFQEELSPAPGTSAGSGITGAAISFGTTKKQGNFISRIFGSLTGFAVQQPSQDIKINKTEATGYEVSYETPGPTATERDIRAGKEVRISGPEDIHYENVLAFTDLPESLGIRDSSMIKIYWVENKTYLNPSSVQDKDGNGVYDYIEWRVPHLSNQTFDIIVVTKAEHLDSNKDFISDIYPEIRYLDGIWSETIPSGDYVKISFEENLTGKNDITLYPRIISGNPNIEVYENNQSTPLTNFTFINDSQYNKVYLTNLTESQDTFDLRVVGGSIQIDHVVDPSVTVQLFPDGAGTYTAFSVVPAALAHWQAVNDTTANNSNYIRSITRGQNDSYSLGNITLPPGAVVTNLTVYALAGRYNGTATYAHYFIMIRDLGTNYNGSVNTATSAYRLNFTSWTTDPKTGAAWNESGINNLEAGIYDSPATNRGINISQMYVNITYSTDDVAPTITLPIYTNATQYQDTDSLVFNISVSDSGAGPAYCSINVGGGSNQTLSVSSGWCNGTYALTGLSAGNQIINAYSNDTAGNLGLNDSYVVQISGGADTTPPQVTISVPQNTTYHRVDNFPLTFNISLNEPGSVMYSIDNQTDNVIGNTSMDTIDNQNFTSVLDDLSPDNYTFNVYANDTAGNNNYSKKINFQVIQQHVIINGTLYDADGNLLNTTLIVTYDSNSTVAYNDTGTDNNVTVPIDHNYTVNIHPEDISTVDEIEFKHINFTKIDKRVADIVKIDGKNNGTDGFDNVFAIDNQIDQNATVTFTAQANSIYKCADWDFVNQNCPSGNWTLFMTGLRIGQTYNFTMEPGDPGFGIININGAQHLDSSRGFISNIYSEVRDLDDVWSETIPSGDYVRASFDQELTSSNDITLFPRTISGNPSIEVYEANQSTLIANFTSLLDNYFNKIYLTNLSDNQSTFDLRVVGGSVQFDQIVDPTFTLQIFPDGPGRGNNFTNIVNGTIAFGVVNESPANDSNFVWSNTAAQNETYSLGNVTIPAGANVSNVTVYIRGTFWNTTRNTSSIMIISGLTGGNGTTRSNGSNSNKTASFTTCSTANCSAYWQVNPSGGLWNQTTVNGLEAGIRLSPIAARSGINLSQLYVNVTYVTDTVAPAIVNLNSPVDAYNSTNTSIIFNATMWDDMFPANMTLYGNWSGAWAANLTNSTPPKNNTQTSFNVTGLAEGRYIWNVLACDMADNCAFNTTGNRTLTIDRTPPVVNVTSYTNATKYKNTQSLTFNISLYNALAGPAYCSINVGGGTNQTIAVSSNWCNGTYALTGIADGNKTINAYANDTAGNMALNSTYVAWIDTTAPVITVNNPANNTNSTTTSNVFSANLSDGNGVGINYTILYGNFSGTWGINSTNISVVNGTQVNFTVSLPAGIYTWAYWANDSMGNSGFSGNETISVDATPPTYSNNQTNTSLAGAAVNFSLLVDDNLALQPNGQYIFSTNNTGTWVNDSSGGGSPTFDAINSAVPADSADTCNITLTVGAGSNIYLIAGFLYAYGGGTTNTPTVNGSVMTLINDSGAQDGEGRAYMYGYKNPSAGPHLISFSGMSNTNGRSVCYAISYSGIDQTTPFSASATNYSSTGGTPSVTIASATGELVVEGDALRDADYTSSAFVLANGQTQRLNVTSADTGSTGIRGVVAEKAGAATVVMNWSGSAGYNPSMVAVSLRPASGGNTKFTSTPQWANVTKALNSTSGTVVGYRWYLTDNAGNKNNTGIYTVTTTSSDSTPPTYSNNQTNSTLAGTAIIHSLYWTDNVALSGYIFSLDNGTGTFANDSFVSMTGGSNWSNVTKLVNLTVGSTIRWIVYANDSANNWNASQTFSYATTVTPQIGLTVLYPPGNLNASQNNFFNVTLNVTCLAGVCGTVNASLYLNSSSTQVYGLNFSGSDGVTDSFNFSSPISYPATYIWRVYPRQQDVYYTAFFYGNKATFQSGNDYYGFHPYPNFDGVNSHAWEIASPNGGDWIGENVTMDQWYQQAAVVYKSANGSYTYHTFFYNWPDTTKNVTHIDTTARSPPTNPTLNVGDAPWNLGNEEWDGYMRDFQFYNGTLDTTQIAQEIASPGSVLTPWYLNLNPTPTDISDKSGNGHDPTWMGADRPALWTGNSTQTGLIPMNSGTPFYTNVSNPFTTASLSSGQSEIVTFWVNATGNINESDVFLAFANTTSNQSISNITGTWNVTISNSSSNSAPTVPFVSAISATDPTIGTTTSVTFNFTATDADGMANINNATAAAYFNMTGETTRSNTSCTPRNASTNSITFTCTILMWYYDKIGTWSINATIQDNSAAYAENSTTTFTYNSLTAMVMAPISLNWTSLGVASTNTGSSNDPVIINNTGNAGPLSINVTAYNLRGETTTSQFIYAANFTVDNVTEGCSGIAMANATSKNITNANISRGNNSLNYNNATSGQRQIFFCLKGVLPSLTAQSYSSAAYGAWTVTVLLVAVMPLRRKKKRNEKKGEHGLSPAEDKLKKDKLILALGLIMDELKQEYSSNKKEVVRAIADKIKDRYGISRGEILEIIKDKDMKIPTSIFSNDLGALESLVKYMKENLNMSYREISKEIGRNERTVWSSYKKASSKKNEGIITGRSGIKEETIPISSIKGRKFTVLESVIIHLKNKGLKFSEIARLLERDQRNVWTVYSRAKRKGKQNY